MFVRPLPRLARTILTVVGPPVDRRLRRVDDDRRRRWNGDGRRGRDPSRLARCVSNGSRGIGNRRAWRERGLNVHNVRRGETDGPHDRVIVHDADHSPRSEQRQRPSAAPSAFTDFWGDHLLRFGFARRAQGGWANACYGRWENRRKQFSPPDNRAAASPAKARHVGNFTSTTRTANHVHATPRHNNPIIGWLTASMQSQSCHGSTR
jgi:hypothetical protein